MKQTVKFGSPTESIVYPILIIAVMWVVYWAEQLFTFPFHEYGILPRTIEGLKGIIFMPFIHSEQDVNHIINNSFPTLVLSAAIIYFYREIALKVFISLWIGTGIMLWIYAQNKGAYHIGMSGLIYGMVGFLFTSGVIRKYLPLQAISLFVVFVYGNLIWGIFPIKAHVSWEGHFMGLVVGLIVALAFRQKAIQRPKFQYEIEQEMGIEPPDFEGIYNEQLRQAKLREEEFKRQVAEQQRIIYHFVPEKKDETNPPADDSKTE